MYFYLLQLILKKDTFKYFTIVKENSKMARLLNKIKNNEVFSNDMFFDFLNEIFMEKIKNSKSLLEKNCSFELLYATEKMRSLLFLSEDKILEKRAQCFLNENNNEILDDVKHKLRELTERSDTSWCWNLLVMEEFDKNYKKLL